MYQQALRTLYPHVPVTYVPSAEEALVEVTTFTVDLMIVDIRLPGMSGIDLVRRVRLRQPNIKVIMITGMYIDEDLKRQSREVGAAHLLSKPVSVSDFLAKVQETLGEDVLEAEEKSSASEKSKGETAPLKRQPEQPPPPPAVIVSVEPSTPGPSLSEALTNLRSSLGGLAVLLLDDTGRVTAQAGDWLSPDQPEQIVPDLMASLSAVHRVSRQVGAPLPEAVVCLRGREYDLLCAPVGRYALLLFLKSGPGALRAALAFEEVLLAQKQIARVLGEMGLNVNPIPSEKPILAAPEEVIYSPAFEEETVPEPAPAELKALEDILGEPAQKEGAQNANDFWDNLSEGEAPAPSDPDVLTYEQARKLGLLPEE
jgi:CheY-like chemotaxis protein